MSQRQYFKREGQRTFLNFQKISSQDSRSIANSKQNKQKVCTETFIVKLLKTNDRDKSKSRGRKDYFQRYNN